MDSNPPKKSADREYYLFALKIIGDFGATIAVPVVVLSLLGEHFDQKFQFHTPWLTISGFALAAFLSGINIYRKAKRYGKEYQNMNQK